MTVQILAIQRGTWPGRRPHPSPVVCPICGATIGFRRPDGDGTWPCRKCRIDVFVLRPEDALTVPVQGLEPDDGPLDVDGS